MMRACWDVPTVIADPVEAGDGGRPGWFGIGPLASSSKVIFDDRGIGEWGV